MKKVFFLLTMLAVIGITNAAAQQRGGGDPAAMMARMKERIKPQLIEQVKLTDAQADKVVEIYADAQRQARELRNDQTGTEEDRKKKIDAIAADRDKKFAAIPLTAEQVVSVNAFFEEMRKNAPQRGGGN